MKKLPLYLTLEATHFTKRRTNVPCKMFEWCFNLYLLVLNGLVRRQIDIVTYKLLYFLPDTSLCLFVDEFFPFRRIILMIYYVHYTLQVRSSLLFLLVHLLWRQNDVWICCFLTVHHQNVGWTHLGPLLDDSWLKAKSLLWSYVLKSALKLD